MTNRFPTYGLLPLILLLTPIWSFGGDPIPAFPGAEGFGARTPGGRGGKVFFVRNLNDSGPGSLRAACDAKGPRIVVFRVGGIIDLKSELTITEPFLTIAGQTAPGDGICLRGDGLRIRTHDVILRFIRSRPGDNTGSKADAIAVAGDSRNVIVDHCSASWSIDEALSPSDNISNITVQWCIISEALNRSIHHKGPHGYGSLARASGGVSLHHNLWAHNDARNPRLGDNYHKPPFPTFDVRNNVMYNYGKMCSGLTGDSLQANYVANYIKPGPDSSGDRRPIVFTDKATTQYYVSGNAVVGNPEMTKDNFKLFDRIEVNGHRFVTRITEPFDTPKITTTPAAAALEAVLENAGATRPARDSVDARIVREVRNGTGSIIDSQWEVGGWPEYRFGRPLPDRDGDGIPDAWEKAHGLNPASASDAAAIRESSGYTNIEEYINDLARPTGSRASASSK